VNETVKDLISLLDLEAIEVNMFRGRSVPTNERGVYGGQVIGQALVAAERTVEARAPHSLHGYFLLPGDGGAPILYQVERIRDGKSFSTRRVQAVQHGRIIFSMIASFQIAEPGFDHASAMPAVPPPEALPSTSELGPRWVAEAGRPVESRASEWLTRRRPIEIRPVAAENPLRPSPRAPDQAFWFRASEPLPDDPQVHRCLLAYATDHALLTVTLRPHGTSWILRDTMVASLDHALWFHRPARFDEWLLYAMDSPSAQAARGLARGQIFDRAGRLVASVAQEGLIRDLKQRATGSNGGP
jgi:acyl-CoA thioesterase-2